MTAIIVIAHTPLASALRSCVAHVFPEDAHCVQVLDVPATYHIDEVVAQAEALLPKTGEALVLTDIFWRNASQRGVALSLQQRLSCSGRCEFAHVAARGVLPRATG